MSKYAGKVVFVLTFLAGLIWAGDIYTDRQYRLAVIASALLYSLPPHEYPISNPALATLKPNDELRVLRMRYGKDFQAFRVETKSGLVGWVIGGDGIKVLSHG